MDDAAWPEALLKMRVRRAGIKWRALFGSFPILSVRAITAGEASGIYALRLKRPERRMPRQRFASATLSTSYTVKLDLGMVVDGCQSPGASAAATNLHLQYLH